MQAVELAIAGEAPLAVDVREIREAAYGSLRQMLGEQGLGDPAADGRFVEGLPHQEGHVVEKERDGAMLADVQGAVEMLEERRIDGGEHDPGKAAILIAQAAADDDGPRPGEPA